MAKVYMVTDGSYSDYRVLGIYSTKAKAEDAKVLFNAENDVEPIELDATPEVPPGMLKWVVTMGRSGDSGGARRDSCEYSHVRASLYAPWNSTDVLMRASLWAKDEERAVKIANEWRTRIVANNLWTDGTCLEPGKDF